MNLPITISQDELLEVLLSVAPSRPVFIWGAPGIGKSALVEEFAIEVGLECVSLLGSQLAPEDIIGIPQIRGNTSEFLPPKMIARDEPYVLFLDELNACTQEVQKAFYSLIYERRVGEYHLPEGSIVIGAGNRAQDSAIVKTMSSALINRMFQKLDAVIRKTEEPFSTPRSWHMLSDALKEFGAGEKELSDKTIRMLAYGSVSAAHAGMFAAFIKQMNNRYLLSDIIKGEARWPDKPEDRDVLYFLSQSFRAQLVHDLPEKKAALNKESQYLAHRAKALIKELAKINYELAQMVVSSDDGKVIPEWFMIEIVRDLPRLVAQEKKKDGKTA